MTEAARPRPRPGPGAGAQPKPAETETPTAVERPGRWPAIVAAVLAAVVLAAFLAVNIWLFLVRSDNDDTENARVGALADARTRVPAMLSYTYKTMNSYVAAAPKNTTGRFKNDFSQLVTKVIAPAAKQQQITTQATVKSAGIIEAHPDTVVVLVLLDQVTTSKSSSTPQIDGSRVKATMQKVGDTWLVGLLTQV